MKSAIGKARKRLFDQDDDARPYATADNLSEEYVPDPTEGGNTAYRDRDVPPGLSERDATVLRTVKRRANVLDKSFNLCGVRFGWTFVIAIIPVVGDALHPVIGYLLVVRQASKAKLPKALTRRMILNLAISAAIGIVPILGDILLASYRANVRLLENFLHLRGERVAKGGARALSEKNNAGADGDEGEGLRGAVGGRLMEDNTPEETVPDSTEGDDKDKGATAAALVPDHAEDDNMVPTPRPPRNALELLQHRNSRFIEDVT